MKIGYFGLLFLCFLTCDLLTSSLVAAHRPYECYLKPDPGPCHGYFPRYFYNETFGDCELFIYGGCAGNENNFEDIEDCRKTCVCDRCTYQKDPGPCYGYFPRYYYNIMTLDCHRFIYGGCQGNDNNFETYADCINACYLPWPDKASTHDHPPNVPEVKQGDSTQESTKREFQRK